MCYLVSEMWPSLNAFRILSNVSKFRRWLKESHPNIDENKIFEGYVFAIECCLNNFFGALESDAELGIENDFLLNRAISELIPIQEIENSCEKTILLKNLYPYYKGVTKAKTYTDLHGATNLFSKLIVKRFGEILDKRISVLSDVKIKKQLAIKLNTINYVQTFLVQINNNGPTANSFNVLHPTGAKKEKLKRTFNGYKLAIQFLWFSVLGQKRFNETSLKDLHSAKSWRDYVYKNEPDNFDEILLGREFDIEKQDSFDSYFYRISDEIVAPLEKEVQHRLYTIDSIFSFDNSSYDKAQYFEDLLAPSPQATYPISLSKKEAFRKTLFWYDFQVMDLTNAPPDIGLQSFALMVREMVKRKRKRLEDMPVFILRCFHKNNTENPKGVYSYGVLVDRSELNFSTGWIIFKNATETGSGFSNYQHNQIEQFLSKLKKQGKIEIRDIVLSISDFDQFTSSEYSQPVKIEDFEDKKDKSYRVLQNARGYAFELFVYHAFTKNCKKGDVVCHGRSTEYGEIDVHLQFNTGEHLIVECKLTVETCDLQDVLKKLKRKAETVHNSCSTELWFWNQPSTESQDRLNRLSVKTVVVSTDRNSNQYLRGVSKKRLRQIMQKD